jgi:CMP-N,N'-diacetyllegionaminic acid synthase
MNKRILWLIPARSGSKSIPDKNIKLLQGLPLLAYRIKSVMSFTNPEDIWISTDSEKYAQIASSYGATIPFIRPEELSTDNASSMEVVLHAMKHAESTGKIYDGIGLLEPTSPFITSFQLKDAVVKLFCDKDAKHIVATREIRPNTFFVQPDAKYLYELAQRLQTKDKLGRQEFFKEITPSAGFYISKWNAFKKDKTFYSDKTLSYLVPIENELEIDEPIDWLWAEFLIEKEIITTEEVFGI